jgi:DNA repair protein RAD7
LTNISNQKAIAKIKASKKFQRRRKEYGSDEDVSDEDDAARAIFEESMAPIPNQMENCEICDKRFTVTGYTRKGPDGGLVCNMCAKDLNKEEGSARKRRKTAAGQARRKIQSNLLDGIYPGAKSLMTLCIETLAKNVDMAESFGDLPDSLVDRLAAILSKRRLISSKTMDLFLRSGGDEVTIYDAANLTCDDFIRIFQVVPTVKKLRLRNSIQFKNKVMDHLLGTTVKLESLSLHGSNLIDDERWNTYLTLKGPYLRELKVYWTDGHFGDEQVELLAKTCPDLRRLKLAHNQKLTDKGVEHIANLPNVQYLTLEIYGTKTSSGPYVKVLDSIGPGLRTFSLRIVNFIDDSVLKAIHDNCQTLSKLRITDNEVLTDQGFTDLFNNWLNPGLRYIDFNKCRHLDAAEPNKNPDNTGLGSAGFEALMAHSGETLEYLDVHSCRHISQEAFENVFAEDKNYLKLESMDASFCHGVSDFVVGSIFRSCPNIKTLSVFGNFGVRDVRVPKGKILIGVPNAMGMQIEGTDDGEGRVI